MTKYTGKPWRAKRVASFTGLYNVYDKDGNILVYAKVAGIACPMAAALELLAACEAAFRVVDWKDHQQAERLLMFNAIAKATGELTYDHAMDELGFGEE